MERCIVGHVDSRALAVGQSLEGRLAQVTEFFSASPSAKKNCYSVANKGVCLAALVDGYYEGDDVINSYLDPVESDQSDAEE